MLAVSLYPTGKSDLVKSAANTAGAVPAETDKVGQERIYSHRFYMLGSFSFFFMY